LAGPGGLGGLAAGGAAEWGGEAVGWGGEDGVGADSAAMVFLEERKKSEGALPPPIMMFLSQGHTSCYDAQTNLKPSGTKHRVSCDLMIDRGAEQIGQVPETVQKAPTSSKEDLVNIREAGFCQEANLFRFSTHMETLQFGVYVDRIIQTISKSLFHEGSPPGIPAPIQDL